MLPRAQAILTPPPWAGEWNAAGHAVLRSAVARGARNASAEGFRHLAREAYARLFAELADAGHPHLVRMWNFVPDIHATLDNGEDRYMAFNAGRHDAMVARHGPSLPLQIPAATGVGHWGEDLVVCALGQKKPGRPVDNALQTPAYRYSKRYGHLPPCFARATKTDRGLLISGTAAIRGEDTRALDDLGLQVALTLENLAALTGENRLTSARAYVPPQTDPAEVRTACEGKFDQLEIVEAELCRKNLLVEIEGVVLS